MARTPINQGSNGFHFLTLVTDGYGTLIAEDANGEMLARAEIKRAGDVPTPQEMLLAVTQVSELAMAEYDRRGTFAAPDEMV